MIFLLTSIHFKKIFPTLLPLHIVLSLPISKPHSRPFTFLFFTFPFQFPQSPICPSNSTHSQKQSHTQSQSKNHTHTLFVLFPKISLYSSHFSYAPTSIPLPFRSIPFLPIPVHFHFFLFHFPSRFLPSPSISPFLPTITASSPSPFLTTP